MTPKPNILDLSRPQLAGWFEKRGVGAYRASQVMKWLYQRQVDAFDAMTDLSKAHRLLLAAHFSIRRLALEEVAVSGDGSRKYLFRMADGAFIESVLMPERDHDTLCVSSQVGCAQGCLFCRTGSGGLHRNLSLGEIVSQIRDVRRDMAAPGKLTNIVFMGMGEPLANYARLTAALEIIADNRFGFGFAQRRITVSTAGLVPKMAALGRDAKVNLAVSLNATDDDTRNRLMPINRAYPLASLLAACREYPVPRGRRLTFEYILIRGINDSKDDARRLAKMLRPMRCKINLIPFNPHEGCGFERPEEQEVTNFQQLLLDAHYTAIVRQSKGQDISAACGQLRARAMGVDGE